MKTIATMRALDKERGAVRVEDVYDTDIDDLWEACTTPERLVRWIGEVSGDLRARWHLPRRVHQLLGGSRPHRAL